MGPVYDVFIARMKVLKHYGAKVVNYIDATNAPMLLKTLGIDPHNTLFFSGLVRTHIHSQVYALTMFRENRI